jgi:hypothetical protein
MDQALASGMAWSKLPIRLVFLGTPHHGAPLERAGSWVDMLIGVSPYSAPFVRLGKIRSAGIQDLRHGNLRDADWQEGDGNRDGNSLADGRTPMPLPGQVQAYAMAACRQEQSEGANLDSLAGDGLVPLASALGRHPHRGFDLRIPKSRQWVGYGINHLEILGSQAAYQRIRRWLRKPIA